ncbi:polyphosphate polymerase domain-containing protein [Microbacterium halophytorum]|uniref:polyphosphate polymerase domain-containing protein n=1 Tax=Microbacterium halophytorum TaxID=2067568 RepID=UPI001E4FF106|nr:polyphosphate polymerase domain-containing protein [Microbacterium halophytorum]
MSGAIDLRRQAGDASGASTRTVQRGARTAPSRAHGTGRTGVPAVDPAVEAAARFAPISLEELIAEAELLTRVDRKYLVPIDQLGALLGGLGSATRVLEIQGERGSAYASMYFDTPGLLSYRLAARGRRRRFKLRSRHYVDTGDAFLEMKTKGARGATVKERIPHPVDAVDELTPDGREYAAIGMRALGLDTDAADALRPVLRTTYRRTTLLLPDGGRATVDTELAWEGVDGARLDTPRLAIVETKSASRPSGFDRRLWRSGIRPDGISKFATGLAAMHPELPSNKWSRVLRTHFAR